MLQLEKEIKGFEKPAIVGIRIKMPIYILASPGILGINGYNGVSTI
jgi:hypothetical protein